MYTPATQSSSINSSFAEWMRGSEGAPSSVRFLTMAQRGIQITMFVVGILTAMGAFSTGLTVGLALLLTSLSVACIVGRSKLYTMNKVHDRTDVMITVISAIFTTVLSIVILSGGLQASSLSGCLYGPFIGVTVSMISSWILNK